MCPCRRLEHQAANCPTRTCCPPPPPQPKGTPAARTPHTQARRYLSRMCHCRVRGLSAVWDTLRPRQPGAPNPIKSRRDSCADRGSGHPGEALTQTEPNCPKSAKKSRQISGPILQQNRFPMPWISVPGPKYTFLLAALWLESCGKPKYVSIFKKHFHPPVCTWSLSISLPDVDSTLVVYAWCDKPIGGGSIPAQTLFVTCPAVVNLMGNSFFPAPTNPATRRQMHTGLPLKHHWPSIF